MPAAASRSGGSSSRRIPAGVRRLAWVERFIAATTWPEGLRLCERGQRQAGQEGVAELQHPRREREAPVLRSYVAEFLERQQEAPRRGPGKPGVTCHVRQRSPLAGQAHRSNHVKTPLQRL